MRPELAERLGLIFPSVRRLITGVAGVADVAQERPGVAGGVAPDDFGVVGVAASLLDIERYATVDLRPRPLPRSRGPETLATTPATSATPAECREGMAQERLSQFDGIAQGCDPLVTVADNKGSALPHETDDWLPEDWLAFFDERAGIAEFDGALARADAEAQAREACISEWLNRSLAPSEPDRCCECGEEDDASDPLLPHGVETRGHVWLHSRCWPRHCDRRQAEAVAALRAMGMG